MCEIECRREGVLANPSHSAASYCLIYHSAKNESWCRRGRGEENDGDRGRKVELTEMKRGEMRQDREKEGI